MATLTGGGYKQVECRIRGLCPTIMNNGRKANPMDEFAKAMRAITSSRKRGDVLTDDQAEELARLEFMGGLYVDEDGDPCWPGENLEAMMHAGARKYKDGPKCEVGILIDGNWALDYDGPKDPKKLWENPAFRKTCIAKPNGKPVLRTRPIFMDWALTFRVFYDPEVVDVPTIRKWLEMAGARVGLSDWRPKYGRFTVEEVKEV